MSWRANSSSTLAMSGHGFCGAAVCFGDHLADFGVDLAGDGLTVVAMLSNAAPQKYHFLPLAIRHRSKSSLIPKLHDHFAGELGGALQVVAGARCDSVKDDLLGSRPPNMVTRSASNLVRLLRYRSSSGRMSV